MALTFVKVNSFVDELASATHNLTGEPSTHAVRLYLSNTALTATHTTKTEPAEITNQNGYTGPIDCTFHGVSATGTFTFSGLSPKVEATGTVGPFQSIVLFNDTHASDALIGGWNRAEALTLEDGESYTMKFNNADEGARGTILTIA